MWYYPRLLHGTYRPHLPSTSVEAASGNRLLRLGEASADLLLSPPVPWTRYAVAFLGPHIFGIVPAPGRGHQTVFPSKHPHHTSALLASCLASHVEQSHGLSDSDHDAMSEIVRNLGDTDSTES